MSVRTLVIGDGGLATGAACAAAVDARLSAGASTARGDVGVLWRPSSLVGPDRLAAATRSVDLFAGTYGFEALTDTKNPGVELSGEVRGAAGLGVSATLLLGLAIAGRARCERVVWAMDSSPTTGGVDAVDLNESSRVLDRCLLLERLAMLESDQEIRVEAPFADLSDQQVAEIALDLSVPVSACWWWTADDHARRRWTAALQTVGWTETLVEPVTARTSVK